MCARHCADSRSVPCGNTRTQQCLATRLSFHALCSAATMSNGALSNGALSFRLRGCTLMTSPFLGVLQTPTFYFWVGRWTSLILIGGENNILLIYYVQNKYSSTKSWHDLFCLFIFFFYVFTFFAFFTFFKCFFNVFYVFYIFHIFMFSFNESTEAC